MKACNARTTSNAQRVAKWALLPTDFSVEGETDMYTVVVRCSCFERFVSFFSPGRQRFDLFCRVSRSRCFESLDSRQPSQQTSWLVPRRFLQISTSTENVDEQVSSIDCPPPYPRRSLFATPRSRLERSLGPCFQQAARSEPRPFFSFFCRRRRADAHAQAQARPGRREARGHHRGTVRLSYGYLGVHPANKRSAAQRTPTPHPRACHGVFCWLSNRDDDGKEGMESKIFCPSPGSRVRLVVVRCHRVDL